MLGIWTLLFVLTKQKVCRIHKSGKSTRRAGMFGCLDVCLPGPVEVYYRDR